MNLRIYSDGASRGNPGQSAIAFLILNEKGKMLRKYSRYVGIITNNQAEYQALISALEVASELKGQAVSCYLDSELVVKQLNGEYQVRDSELKILWCRVQESRKRFQRITFTHVSRGDRQLEQVDRLANQALNEVSDGR